MSEVEDRDRSPDRTSARWLVSGRVQGVGFRYHVLQSARRFAILGDVRNLPDGRVEVRAKGPVDRMDDLLTAIRTGPPGARVESVESLVPEKGLNFDPFTIR